MPQRTENDWVLKGHGFSRADEAPKTFTALAAEGKGMQKGFFPQGLKPKALLEVPSARLKPCPFNARKTLEPVSLAIIALATVLLGGCKPVGPDYNRPAYQAPASYKETGASTVLVPPPSPVAGGWQPATPSDGLLRGKWWEIYNDPQLNRLEERIDPSNQTLRQAAESYLAAHEQVVAARSGLLPTLSAGLSSNRERPSVNGTSYNSARPNAYSDNMIAGQASWEPDLWGRVRRTVEAARSNAQASAADLASIGLSLHAELAADYFQLRGLDAQIKLLDATVISLEGQLDLTQRRLSGGVGTEADVAQARTQLETVRAQRVDLDAARSQFEHAIGTLANLDLEGFSIPVSPLQGALPQIPLGLPSQLLERRPDIAAAERRAAAANAQIGIAASAFYPNISLGAAGGFESTHAGTWIQGPTSLWSLGAQATQLLFDAGQRRAYSDEARHAYEAQSAAYKATVLAAFQGVEDQLSSLRILEQECGVEQGAVASAQHSLALSNQRYQGGVSSYLEVLTAETALLQNQRTATDLQTRQFVASVGLVRALGGGWNATQLPK